MININQCIQLQRDSIIYWQQNGINLQHSDFLALVEENHAFNYQLWHAEDRARRDDLGHLFVYTAKREIDKFNQQRNDRMEKIDIYLFDRLKPSTDQNIPIHSETPGMMLDRLSILSLKNYYMSVQTERTDVDANHKTNCLNKLQILNLQQERLKNCLIIFLEEIYAKTRTFCVYHQCKMYNDPKLNPQLYCAR